MLNFLDINFLVDASYHCCFEDVAQRLVGDGSIGLETTRRSPCLGNRTKDGCFATHVAKRIGTVPYLDNNRILYSRVFRPFFHHKTGEEKCIVVDHIHLSVLCRTSGTSESKKFSSDVINWSPHISGGSSGHVHDSKTMPRDATHGTRVPRDATRCHAMPRDATDL